MNNITIQDVAMAAGVSKTTVSRFLNGKYQYMSEETRNKIEQVIAELEYVPSKQARSLKSKQGYLIGLIVADIGNVYTMYLIKAVQDALSDTKYQLVVMSTDNSLEKETHALKELAGQDIAGLILQPVGRADSPYEILTTLQVPVVLIDRYLETVPLPSVVTDNFTVTRRLGQQIAAAGYDKLVHVTHPLCGQTVRQHRYDAMMLTAFEAKIELKLIESPIGRGITPEEIRQEINGRTMFFGANGNVLQELVTACKKGEIRYPEEIGLTGFDDWFWADLLTPTVTSIHQQPAEIGRQSLEYLLAAINGEAFAGRLEIAASIFQGKSI